MKVRDQARYHQQPQCSGWQVYPVNWQNYHGTGECQRHKIEILFWRFKLHLYPDQYRSESRRVLSDNIFPLNVRRHRVFHQ